MIGKSSEIKTCFIDACFISDLQQDVNRCMKDNPDWGIIDIRYQTAADPHSDNGIYHIALIIYKEATQ